MAVRVAGPQRPDMPPQMFPVGSHVQIPHIGGDSQLKAERTQEDLVMKPPHQPTGVSEDYVKKISVDISFDEDVVRDRAFHSLPYSTKFLRETLDGTDVVPRPPRKPPGGRYNTQGGDRRHLPCHIEKRSTHKLKPIKRKILDKVAQMQQEALAYKAAQQTDSSRPSSGDPEVKDYSGESVFLTEAPTEDESSGSQRKSPDHAWDEYLVSILSKETAQWVVHQRTSAGQRKDRLKVVFKKYHGPPDDTAELVRDDASDCESPTPVEEDNKSKWKNAEETMLDKVREMTKHEGKDTDPYGEDHVAAFYRLPAGFRRAKKRHDKEEEGAINSTAHNLEVETFQPSPPPTLADFMNPAVGDKMYPTTNKYEQELLTGTEHVHQMDAENDDYIVLANHNRYKKMLQPETPRQPDAWYKDKDSAGKKKGSSAKHKRGLQRWKALPKAVDQESNVLNPFPDEGDDQETMELSGHGHDETTEAADPSGRKETRNNSMLVQIVNEWRSKWHLDMRYADASPEDLIRDMADIHPHIRLKAITTCARAAEYRPPPEPGIQLDSERKTKPGYQLLLLPEELFVGLELCLNDEHEQVRRAAAIALYTLEHPTKQAEEILRETLMCKSSIDRWTASQCLAYYGECDSDVVGELIWQLLNAEDTIKQQRAVHLLTELSKASMLVHSMLAEQMNSESWRHRVISCRAVPKLHGQINKDMVNKLTWLMWHDWHSEVRKAAAQTLGRTGHGKDVHDELLAKLHSTDERERMEAVSKIGHLGIMTAKLLPFFLQCFEDSYVSVRQEICIACTNLRIQHEQVLDALVHLATYDPIWKVKALAIQALGVIGVVNDTIRDCILWAVRYEDKEGVRAQACHTVYQMELNDADVVQILQDRFLVETSPVVKAEIWMALELFGISPTDDLDMVARIKGEVRKLCTRANVAAQITLNEKEESRRDNIDRMIYRSKEEQKEDQKRELPRIRPVVMEPTGLTNGRESAGSRLYALYTPDQSTLGMHSHGATSATPSATDQELQAIFAQYDRMTPDISLTADSPRPDSAQTRNTMATGFSLDDALSQGASQHTPKGKGLSQTDDTRDMGSPSSTVKSAATPAKAGADTTWTDSYSYVEVNAAGFSDTEQQPDVLKVEHQSPRQSVDGDSIPVTVVHEAESPSRSEQEDMGSAPPIEGDSVQGSPVPSIVVSTHGTPVQREIVESALDRSQEPVADSDGPGGNRTGDSPLESGLSDATNPHNDPAKPSSGSHKSIKDSL